MQGSPNGQWWRLRHVRRLLCGLLLLPLPVFAYNVEGLYETVVTLADAGEPARRQGFREALQQVVVRLTADTRTTWQANVQGLLQAAESYVESYEYLPAATAGQAGVAATGPRLRVRFRAAALQAALRRAGVSLWGRERPLTLAWVVAQTGNERRVLGGDRDDPLLDGIERQARALGLPLIFPLLDLDETRRLGASQLWAGFEDPLLAASRRYQADAVVLLRLDESSGGLHALWTLYLRGGRIDTWQTRSVDRDNLLATGMSRLAGSLADRFGRITALDEERRIHLRVSGIDSFGAYRRVLLYLRSLEAVDRVQVADVGAGKVSFLLGTRVSEEALRNAISTGSLLAPEAGGWFRLSR